MPAKWRRLIFAGGQVDRRLYETAVLAILRERLRGGDIWVAGSRDWRAFEDHLLPGALLPSTILRKLAAAGPGSALSRALRAIGRIERTLFTLQWLSDPELRQRSHAGLNKGEASNALRRAVRDSQAGDQSPHRLAACRGEILRNLLKASWSPAPPP